MRITGGEWRSRRLRGPGRGRGLRPTPDALRERAFAILADRVTDAAFLDLYAGTGAVGFEALSRGAARVLFVERERSAARLIEANRRSLDIDPGRARLLVRSAAAAITSLARTGERFDAAWADPPFADWEDGLEIVARAFAEGLLTHGAIACLECPAQADLAALPAPLHLHRDLAGGASRLAMRVVGDGQT